ncbi:unnamed protein product [Haemonchus placei]|uniref:Uncharacterized protein n=1 Tax=Haemonchus placei TaxID=6290 RepID=A0A0N4W986_HAEPC|nr:unnamed protein product [Haemonchus placei]
MEGGKVHWLAVGEADEHCTRATDTFFGTSRRGPTSGLGVAPDPRGGGEPPEFSDSGGDRFVNASRTARAQVRARTFRERGARASYRSRWAGGHRAALPPSVCHRTCRCTGSYPTPAGESRGTWRKKMAAVKWEMTRAP